MSKQWIVVADAARARLFTRNIADQSLTLIDTLKHSESEAHEGDLRTGARAKSTTAAVRANTRPTRRRARAKSTRISLPSRWHNA